MSTLDALGDILTVERIITDGVPSASVALLEDGKVSSRIFTQGNNNTDTIYQACSISKAITALGVAKLVDEGRFSYDTKVADHLSQDVLDTVLDSRTAHFTPLVTVRMLLSHTSGLSQGGFPGYVGECATPVDILAGKPPSNTPKVRFTSFPGAQFSYSGGGFTLLQLFLESVMGVSFSELMHEVVLKPLNMQRSHFGDISSSESNYAKAHWTGVLENEAGYHKFSELAAAGLWSTPSDLLKAIAAIQNSLKSEGGYLKKETARTMLTVIPQSSASYGGMGLGWAVEDDSDSTQGVFAHQGGSLPGYSCYLLGFQQNTNGLAVMTNSIDGFRVCVRKVVSALYFLKSWPQPVKLPSAFGKCDHVPYAAPHGHKVDKAWEDWKGNWEGGWSLTDVDGEPKLGYGDFPAMALRPAAMGPVIGEVVFVVDGLEVAVRMWKSHGEYMIELWQAEPRGLRRVK